MVGIGLGLGDWASPLCLAAFGTAAFVQRIKVEEVTLRQALGQPYEAYATKHARLLPGADWIDQYESRHRRTAEAGENLRGRLHRAGLASIASSALSIAVTASWIAAVFNRFVLRDLDRFAKLGRRSGAAALLRLPFILPAAAAAVRWRFDSQSQQARLPMNRAPAFIALGSAMAFVATFIATLLLA